MFERPRTGERAVLVRLGLGAPIDPEDLEEFTQLALSAGALPVATVTGRRERPDPRYFLGTGKAAELREVAAANDAEVILVDHALSPSQERNLEKLIERRVLDRNGLILDIFAQRARSHEGKLEDELAQLKHIASRLVRGWTHLERQKGGIGLRGPGETQLETDRRIIGQRVRVLGKRLARIKQQRETGRQMRAEIPVPSLALVGYTNAGKSTLFRALTGADAYVADQLFATLDPTVRRIALPLDLLETLLQILDLAGHEPAIGLELRLARTAQADTAFLALEVGPAAHQAAADVLQLRELDFELALEAAGALREDIEDQAVAIQHALTRELLEVALLARGERVIDEDEIRFRLACHIAQLLRLAAAEEITRVGPLAAAGHGRHGARARRERELRELLEVLRVDRRAQT